MIFSKYTNQDNLTFIFKIPNIHNLFIFRENWDNDVIMRKVIAELLQYGQFETMYIGNKPDTALLSNPYNCDNCALIALTVQDLKMITNAAETATSLFVRELRNHKNRFLFESNILDAANNVTALALSIKVHQEADMEITNAHAA